MNYIDRVLPSLGEDSVVLRAIGGVAVDSLGVTASRIDSATAAAVKGSLRMVELLKRLVNLPLTGEPSLLMTVKGEPLRLGTNELARIRREVLARHRMNAGLPAAEAAVLDALYQRYPEHEDLEFEVFSEFVTDSATYQMFRNAWWPVLEAAEVLRRLADPQVVSQVAGGLFNDAEQAALAASFAAAEWSVADTALLDELMAILGPVPIDTTAEELIFLPDGTEMSEVITTADRLSTQRERDPDEDPYDTFAHVLVDEAQDISPMQWRMLRRRGAEASWTIVGDPAQSSWPDLDEAQRAIDDLIGNAPNRRFRLSTNYRSPAEVFTLAAEVVKRAFPQADLPHAVRTTGIDPVLLRSTAAHLEDRLEQVLSELSSQVAGTIGVIVAPSRLPGMIDAQLPIVRANPDRISFISPLNAKGLEYDAVVVVSPDQIVAESPGGDRVLYVALTRPTQRLVTIDLDGEGTWRP